MVTATNNATGRIFIVDDDDDARIGLERFLKSCGYITESFPSGKAFLDRLPIEETGCLMLDLQMPEMSGLELQQELLKRECSLPIVFLTAHGEVPASVRAIKNGAEDFLAKMADEDELLDAIDRAVGKSVEAMADREKTAQFVECANRLSEREREVCEFVVAGFLNKQIALKLGISLRTVKAHRAQVMVKFCVDSVTDLVRVTQLAGIQPAEK